MEAVIIAKGTGHTTPKGKKKKPVQRLRNLKRYTMKTTRIIDIEDSFAEKIKVVECCKIGPITNENFCPNCGKKVKK